MAVSEVSVSGAFLPEVRWARETIVTLKEAKIRDRPIGLDPATAQPDALFVAFARRDLLFYPYVRAAALSIGTADAYTVNIATLNYYVERERSEELQSVRDRLRELAAARAQGRSVGALTPGGTLDEFASYFAVRGLAIDAYQPGKRGAPEAVDRDIACLEEYLGRVQAATLR